MADSAQYLGSIYHSKGGNGREVWETLHWARSSIMAMVAFWFAGGAPWRFRRLVFVGRVVKAALSGLEAYVLSEQEFGLIDKVVAKLGRLALRGAACDKDADGHPVPASSKEFGGSCRRTGKCSFASAAWTGTAMGGGAGQP